MIIDQAIFRCHQRWNCRDRRGYTIGDAGDASLPTSYNPRYDLLLTNGKSVKPVIIGLLHYYRDLMYSYMQIGKSCISRAKFMLLDLKISTASGGFAPGPTGGGAPAQTPVEARALRARHNYPPPPENPGSATV